MAHRTTFSSANSGANGFEIYPYAATPPRVDVFIRDSSISGWYSGIEYDADWGIITLDADCDDFSDNVYDIYRYAASGSGDVCDSVQ